MLWNWIAYHAQQRPRSLAVILSGQAITYARLAVDVARAADDLRARLPGDARLVGVGIGSAYAHWVCLHALARLQVASVSVVEAGDAPDAGPDLLVADRPWPEAGLPVIEVGPGWPGAGAGVPDMSVLTGRDPVVDFPMRMLVSSGTTGRPKRVMISSRQVLQRLASMPSHYSIGPASRTNVQMGEGTVGGYTIPMCTWMMGGAVVLADEPMFNDRVPPAAKPTFVMLSAANLDAVLARTTRDEEAFPDTRFIIGGSPVAQPIMERARRRLSRRTGMVYGATETGTVTVDMEDREAFTPHCVGYPCPLVEVEVVDDDDRPVPPQVQGQVRIRAAHAATRYEGDPEATAAHFRDGWFYPGDLGVFGPEGRLVITGRIGELFNFGGVKVAPIVLEEVALACPGVADAGACKLSDARGELAVVAVATGEGYDPAALASALKARFGKFRIAVAVLPEIPRNRMGKIERAALVAAVKAATGDAPTHH